MRLVALSVALVLAMAASLSAQEVTGRLEGRVLTPDGTPLSLVAITVTSPGLQGQRIATTDQRGRFLIPALPVGSYQVQARRLGWRYIPWVLKCYATQGITKSAPELDANAFAAAHEHLFPPATFMSRPV